MAISSVSSDRNNMLPTALIEMLMQFWNLEGMKAGVALGIMCRHAFIFHTMGSRRTQFS
jgi:hypothetical protein